MSRLLLLTLSVLSASSALSTDVDPDAFAVPEAAAVREVPLTSSSAGTLPPTEPASEDIPLALPVDPASTARSTFSTPAVPRVAPPTPAPERAPIKATPPPQAPTTPAARRAPPAQAPVDTRPPALPAHDLPRPYGPPSHVTNNVTQSPPPTRVPTAPPTRAIQRCVPQPECEQEDWIEPRRKSGFFIGAAGDLTTIGATLGQQHSVEAGAHLGRAFTLTLVAGRAQEGLNGPGLAFAGLRPGLILNPNRPVSVQGDLMLGYGLPTHQFQGGELTPLNVVEPRLGVGVALGKWGRLDAHAGYRYVPRGQPDAKAFTSPTVGVGLRLGWF